MAKLSIDDVEHYEEVDVDGSGRVYLGKDFAEKRVKFAIKLVDDTE